MFVGGHRQRAERAAVKGFFERDEFGSRLALRVPVAPRELQACLDRFRSAVADESPRQTRQRSQALGDLPLQWMEEQIRGVNERVRLFRNRVGQTLVSVAQRRDADSRQQIEIVVPIRIVESDPLAADEGHRLTAIRLQNISSLASLNVVDHGSHCLTCSPATMRVATWTLPPSAAVSSAALFLPSTITTSPAPCWTASSQARSLAIMPAVAVRSAIRSDMAR